jgi:steroid delta-isomerase-like uncharacterized protein
MEESAVKGTRLEGTDPRAGREMADDAVTVVEALFEAFNDGDLDRAAECVSDDFELVDVAAGQSFQGPNGCRQWLGMFRTALPDARTELVSIFAHGAQVASEHIGRGTQTGPFATPAGTIPPTDRPIELRIGEFYEVRDGKITRLTAYYDTATMMRQLGLMPPAGGRAEKAMTAFMGLGVRARRAATRS